MFDIGWTELLLVGIVALIVVGPKDLPGMFRALGQFTAKLRGMAREFQRAMNEAADESGMGDISKDLKSMNSARNLGLDQVQEAVRDATKWEPGQTQKAMGPETAKLAQERAEAARKIREYSTEKTQARLDAEKAASEGTKAPAKKSTAKKPAAKKTTAAKPAAKKTAAKTSAAKPASAKKAPAKTTAAKTPAAKKPAARKTAAKKAEPK